jgi:hypothetical protein
MYSDARTAFLRCPKPSSVEPDALKIPARRAEYSLTESAPSPFQAEPAHTEILIQSKRPLTVLDGEPIPVRAVDVPLALEKFLDLFQRFSVMLTWHGLELEGREYTETEE